MPTYKTKDGTLSGFLPGIGEIVDGKITVADDVVIENANLELVEETTPPQTPAQPQAAPATPPAAASTPQPAQEQPINKESE